MKKTTKQDDRTNFAIGVSSGIGAMKNRAVFALLGILIGLVCGFKWANHNYRTAQNAGNAARIAEAAKNVTSGVAGTDAASAGQQMPTQITETINKARENPNDFNAQRQAAELFMQIRRPEGALPFLQQANKLKPQDGEVMGDLAGAYFFSGQYPDAVSWARKSLTQTKENRTARFYLAASLILSGQNLPEAEKLLDQVEADSQGAPGDAKQVIAQMRERLQQAKQGNAAGASPEKGTNATTGEAKTMLQHGNTGGQK